MLTIPAAAVPIVAAEARNVLAATDRALLAHAQMFAAVLEGAQGSDLPLNATQDLFARIHAHGGKLMSGREDLRQLVTHLTAVKERSDQKELATGCPGGAPERPSAAPRFFTDAALEAGSQFA
ncbi:MAG: hypothetical protein EON59_02715 [Alphaproteobacteria bacterium]|nr:MAG: hypothetical protein EON59_02715 [Alphaproteobacteria bacterium]